MGNRPNDTRIHDGITGPRGPGYRDGNYWRAWAQPASAASRAALT